MRLALVRRRFDPCGGAELYLHRLLAALVASSLQPEVIAESWSDAPAGVRVHPAPASGDRLERWRQFTGSVARVVDRERFDCVFSLERGIRADVYRAGDGVHAAWIANWRRWGRWWKRLTAGRGPFHRALVAADATSFDPAGTRRVIVNSEMVRAEIRARYAFPNERIHLVRNGVELEPFKSGDRTRLRAQWGIPADACLLLFAGSGWERKGLAWLRRAVAALPRDRYCLVVAGRGRAPWSRTTNERYVGPVPRSEMPHAYAAADLLAFPTLYDPSANACVEALAAGLPVITTRQNGAAELITEGLNGSVVATPDSTHALTAAIAHWADRAACRPVPSPADLSLDRNVRETLAVLELAMRERR
jgi:UDP-glucose:(heptosyl)LPS alpha-1,3-glucosyltransferase